MSKYIKRDTEKLFWSRVNKDGSIPAHCPELGKCWEWTKSCTKQGYGRASYHGKGVRSHRLSWELTYGEIPYDLFVLHKCDNRKCCNPKHLFLGTPLDNVRDMMEKGRNALLMGRLNGNSKLTNEQVDYIIKRYATGGVTQEQLAQEIGVSDSHISNIVNGKVWK